MRAAAVLIVALMAALMAAGETDPRASAAAAAVAAAISMDSPYDHFVPTQVSATVLTVAVHSAEIQNFYCF